MAHDVFISYSSKDKNVADAGCALLEARGVRCWMAPRDILPGSEWGAAIIEAISKSRVMVLIYTSSSNASPQVRREVERAVARGLHVIPFRVEDVPMSPALEYFISTPHWLDALSPPLERHLDHLAKIIRAVLEAQGASGAAPPAGGAFDSAAAAAGPAPASGWSHGPPPGTFATPPQYAVAPAASPTTWLNTRAKKIAVAGGGAALALGVAVALVIVSRSGDDDAAKTNVAKPEDPAAKVAIVAPAEMPKAPAAKPADPPALEKNPLGQSVPEENPLGESAKPAPVPVPQPAPQPIPVPPVAPIVPAESPAEAAKKFQSYLAEGDVQTVQIGRLLTAFPDLKDRKDAAGNTPLHEAAKGGNTGLLLLLLDRGADVKALSAGDSTPLHAAAAAGLTDADLVKSLSSGNVDAKNAAGDLPLHVAVNTAHADAAKLIISAGANANAADKSGRTPLDLALALKDATQSHAVALMLVNAGAKADVAPAGKDTPLHVAASRGDVSLLAAMIQKGAKVTTLGAAGRTPLHLAVLAKQPEAVKTLATAKGAVIDAADGQGNTPLHLAAALPEITVAETLLAAGAKVTATTKEKQTPLHTAAASGNVKMVELFMRNGGADVLTKGKPPTPVEVADQAGKKDVAALLRKLEFPAMLQTAINAANQPVPARLIEMIKKDPALAGPIDASGRNAVHLCAVSGNAAFAAELVKIDPSLAKAFTTSEETPLHVAAQNKRANVTKVLLGVGASTRATNTRGDTPLHTAARAGATDVIKALLDAGADPGATNRDDSSPSEVAGDPGTKSLLAAAEKEAAPLRDAWSSLDITGRGFDVTGPGLTQPVRIRFTGKTEFNVEGDINGRYQSFAGKYTKGPLTLLMESTEGVVFPGIPGALYAGKAIVSQEGNDFTLKVGGSEIRFVRR